MEGASVGRKGGAAILTRTTTVLLEGLHDPANTDAWELFDRRYRPIVIGLARRLGLGEADAADVAQETMTRFLEEYRAGRYVRERGRLRSWLLGLARTRIATVYRRRDVRREVAAGEAPTAELPDEAALTRIWDDERRQAILREAMTHLRESTRTEEKTVRAFELLVVGQVPVETVARQLEMSAQDVYLAKSRVARRLRTILESLDSAYEDQ